MKFTICFMAALVGLIVLSVTDSVTAKCHAHLEDTWSGRPAVWERCVGGVTGGRFDDRFVRYAD